MGPWPAEEVPRTEFQGQLGLRHSGGGEGSRSQVHRLLLACEQAVSGGGHRLDVDLNVGLCEQLDDASVGCGHHTVPIDFNDAVPDADAPTLSDATPKEAADDAVLHAKAQLLTDVRPADDGRGDRRAVDDAEGHQRLRLHFLCRTGAVGLAGPPRRGRGWGAARLLVKLQPLGPQFIHRTAA